MNSTGKKKYVLDLGEVKNLAIVYLNGQKVANLWKPPYKTEVTEFIKTGSNLLEIHLTNTAINRLIGDEQYALDAKYKWGGSMISEFPDWLVNPKN